MFFKSRLRKSKSWSTPAIVNPQTRQIEVLHEFDSRSGVLTCGTSGDLDVTNNILTGTEQPASLLNFVIAELINTEQNYVHELRSVIDFYMKPFEAPENEQLLAAHLRDRADILFGNIPDLFNFHNNYLLVDFLSAGNSVIEICQCFVNHRNKFLQLYHRYCQNKPLSEALRRERLDGAAAKFFMQCQKRAGHPLPLSAYLLKPIQRITKYQLLLRELHRHCSDQFRPHVDQALSSMLDLLTRLNTAMHQLHISGFGGDLAQMGPLRLQNECDIFMFKKKTRRLNKAQRRYLFLFDGGLLFCKKRSQALPYISEYYEHKLSIPTCSLGFSETSKTSPTRFEIWDETKSEIYVVQPLDESARIRWIQRLYKLLAERITDHNRLNQLSRPARPQSWTSTVSNDSTRSNDTATDSSIVDGNGNNHNGVCCSSPSSGSPTFVFIMPDERDNNVNTVDQRQTRFDSYPENPLGGLSSSLSSVSSQQALSTGLSSPGVAGTAAIAALNTIVENSSSNELFIGV